MFRKISTARSLSAIFAASFLLYSCADAPRVTDLSGGFGSFALAPYFPSQNKGQTSALAAAFDRVNRFRVVLTRIPSGELALDAVLEVSPGQSVYDLEVEVELRSSDELFSAVITALNGDEILFTSPPLTVRPSLPGEPAPAPVSIPLTYAGPGVEAAVLTLAPAGYAFSPGGSEVFSVEVRDGDGNMIPDVPLSWTIDAPAVASVSEGGLVLANADGIGQVTVTTPNGLSATAWVYVANAELAYVRDGNIYFGSLNFSDVEELDPLVENAEGPVWGPDGSTLFFERGGAIWQLGVDEALVAGSSPSIHPDGFRMAFQGGGGFLFANTDGSKTTQGPEGANPIWLDKSTLLVTGEGGLQRVKANGEERATLVGSSSIAFPYLSADGQKIAFVNGDQGHVYVSGVLGDRMVRVLPKDPASALQANSRPTLSPDGGWLLVAAAGEVGPYLYLAPADGSGPPLPVAGSSGVTQPAWAFEGSLEKPPSVSVSGYEPQNPAPGDEVVISGSGFDWIIPKNNEVIYPEPEGASSAAAAEADEEEEDNILSATPSELRSRVPQKVGPGQLRVVTRNGGEVSIPFTPAAGALEVTATKPPEVGVAGVNVTVVQDGTEVASGTTDDAGQVSFPGLAAGEYEVSASPPNGFQITGDNPQEVTLASGRNTSASVSLYPKVFSIHISPDGVEFAIGESADFTATLWDIEGDPIPGNRDIEWYGGSKAVDVSGSGDAGTAWGVFPTSTDTPSSVIVRSEGTQAEVRALVTSHIEGQVTNGAATTSTWSRSFSGPQAASGAPGITVRLLMGSRLLEITETDGAGMFLFDLLPGGTYTVEVEGGSPPSQTVTLDQATPVGNVSFVYNISGGGDGGEVIVLGDINYWGSGTSVLQANNREMTRNFVTNGSRTRTIWYRGHQAWVESYNPGYYSATGYFGETYNYITQTLGQTLDVVATGSTGSLSIPDDVASFWLWTPQAVFDAADLAEINRYLSNGGRVILIGENNGSTFDLTNQRVQELMASLGSTGIYRDGCYSGVTSDISDDPIMVDVNSIDSGCTSYFTPGTGDDILVRQSSQAIIIRLHLGTPISLAAPFSQTEFRRIPDPNPEIRPDGQVSDPTTGGPKEPKKKEHPVAKH